MGFACSEVLGKFTSYLVGRALPAICLALLAFTTTASAQTYTVLHTFSGGGDGGCPITGLTSGPGGSFYGTTYRCGNGLGTVFRLKQMGAGWILNTLYRFQGGNDGNGPYGRVAVATDGTLYGTTYAGGTGYDICNNGCGTIFRLTPQSRAPLTALSLWNETVLYQFTGAADGGEPQGDLTFDSSGNVYGTAYYGGTVYELIGNGGQWTPSVLYTLGNYNALGGVIFDTAGNLYGVSAFGGLYGQGTVYELSPSASGYTAQTLYSFTGQNDGLTPEGGLIFDSLGNLYGATAYAGNGYNGAVFEVSPAAGGWTFNTLYDLPSGPGVPAGPLDKLTFDANGNLYGTTYDGGANGVGSVFELVPSNGGWTYVSLHDFTGLSDGGFPASTLVLDGNGNLYGTASTGGNGYGVVFEITP
jgi:uncharacterized repeat protein (TIGR03803 family)